jgi:hypothetical protein
MSADESFLSRWSRRKRGAVGRERPSTPASEDKPRDAAAGSEAERAPPVNPQSLPPIESIGAGSDITPFLAPGVPTVLMQAALRRAWSADPAIRDFIGLAENAWDFTAPGGVPGFGSLTAEEAERLLARLTGETKDAEPASAAQEPPPSEQVTVTEGGGDDHAAPEPRGEPQQELPAHPSDPSAQRRRRGGALPQ